MSELLFESVFDEKKVSKYLTKLFPNGKKIKKVLLINPPDADSDLFDYTTAKRGRYTNYPPYGLSVIAKHLEETDVVTEILNLNHIVLKACHEAGSEKSFEFDLSWESKLEEVLKKFQPDFIGITCMFTMTHTSFKRVCEKLVEVKVPIAAGGVHISNDTDRILNDIPEIDIAFNGEGEVAFQKFVNVVNQVKPITEICQLSFQGDEPTKHYKVFKQSRPTTEDLNIIPRFDLIDMSEHSKFGTIGAFYCFKPKETKFATVLSNRGCRARCTFCSVRNFNGPGVRQRDIMSVVDELEYLENEHGIGHVMWLDDDLLLNPKRTIGLFNEMVRRNLKLTWDATNGVIAASCTDEIIAAAAESNCIALNVGMESGNPQILKEVKKPGTIDTFLKASEVLKKYPQIHTSLLLIIGLPNETMRQILDTINVSREMDFDWSRISVLQPLPNTPIYDQMVAQGLIEAVGSKNTRFMGGAYGKQAEIERGDRLFEKSFEDAFSSIGLDSVPDGEQISNIWFYMNYHLNFHRLFSEKRPMKINQQLQNLAALSDVISPENGFALYFQGYLEYKLNNKITTETLGRLDIKLKESSYWQDKFQAFGLSVDDLKNTDFKNKHIPCLAPNKDIALLRDLTWDVEGLNL
jgi:radical SAM superfamily enzyme YgiQ (UPF0313 family)